MPEIIRSRGYWVSGIRAARVASALKRGLGVGVERVEGHCGEFTVLVDGEQVVSGGAPGFVGVLPSTRKDLESVERKLADI